MHLRVCLKCGASAIAFSDALPAFIKDPTVYEVSIQLSPALLKRFILLLKTKSGLDTPQLMERAREGAILVLHEGRASGFHYQLSEYAAAQLPVEIRPPYPHQLQPPKKS